MSPARWIRGPHHTDPKLAGGLALLCYLALAFTIYGHTWFGGGPGQRLAGGGGDPLGFVWFLAWLPHALAHGHSPLFTHALMAPQGANLLNSTAIPLAAFLLWPLTALAGALRSYDLLATLALALSAWAAYFALQRLTARRPIAWIGGLLYGFGGYMDGQATAHVNLLIAVFPPIAALLIDNVRTRPHPLRSGALLGLCAAAQVFIDEEVLATTAILAALALLFAALRRRPSRELLQRHLRAGACAAAIFALIAGPALAYQWAGPEHVGGVFVKSGRYVNDLAGFVIPNPIQVFSSAGSQRLAGGFSGSDGEFGAYLGAPLILLLGWALWRMRTRARALGAGLLLLISVLLSLGPHLHVLGSDTGIWMPWILPGHLPLLKNAVPDRFNLYIWLAAAALLVLLIDDLRERPLGGRPSLGYGLCALALLPVLPNLEPSERVAIPAVLRRPALLAQLAPRSSTVLIAPFNDGQLAMYAQAQSGFAYRVPEGGVFVPGAGGPAYGMRDGPLLYALAALAGRASTEAGRTRTDRLCLARIARNEQLERTCLTHYRNALRRLAVDTVVVDLHAGPAAARRNGAFFTALLGPPLRTQDALVYRVRR